MKRVLIFFIALSVLSCSEKPKGADSKIFTEKEVSDFIRLNPQWLKNPENEAEITEKFKHKMINLSNEPKFLSDFPLQLTSVKDTVVSGQTVKLAVFNAFKDPKRPENSLLNQLELEIRAMMSAEQSGTLQVNQKYLLNGMVYKQGKRGDVRLVQHNETPVYELGRYTFWNMTVKEF